jgi:LysM repeat protein
MIDQRDDNREDFVIDEDIEDGGEALHRAEYYSSASEAFRKRPGMPFVMGGVGLVVLAILLVLGLTRPKSTVDRQYLQTLEARVQQLQENMEALDELDQALERVGEQQRALEELNKKLTRLEQTVTTQIDQIIKELGVLHQRTAEKTAAGAPAPKSAAGKQTDAPQDVQSTAQFHQVRSGETLYRISRRYGLTVDQLRSYNNLAPDAAIYPGQKLKLNPDNQQ